MRSASLAILLSFVATPLSGQTPRTLEGSRAGTAIAHDGSEIRFVVAGTGQRFLLLGPGTASAADTAAMKPWVEGLGAEYRLVFMDYPGKPKPLTLTPEAVARDYLAIADAAGARRFLYYGYSWGAVTGLQLAIRTDRMTAFIAGGFPMLEGPYAEMLQVTAAVEARLAKTPGQSPDLGRQFRTYYEGLRGYDDRAAQARIKGPRLTFAGTADLIDHEGVRVNIGQSVADQRGALEKFGWTVELVEGMNHVQALAPGVAIPLIRAWLRTVRLE
jgi:pimeloyl-ACP methyl ester carboxylesterase